jgi:tRNA (cmo5U34)-methyltransferase
MTQTYRWNVADHAAGYDAAAEYIHPHYVAIQETILTQIARPADAEFLLVDLGGGSGRLAEKFLERFPQATAIVVDQSEPFLEIAAERMARFDGRGACQVAQLQDDWTWGLPHSPQVITSMSAIHHLDPPEKQQLYQRCHDVLDLQGILLNGDEIRDSDDRLYLAALEDWADHMRQIAAAGLVNDAMRPMLEKWEERNVTRFDQPRSSGDDCHETVEAQLGYFRTCGFLGVEVPWREQMWAVLKAVK